jgi:hypothetical protein
MLQTKIKVSRTFSEKCNANEIRYNTQIYKYTNIQIYKYTNIQIYKYTNIQIIIYKIVYK